MDEPRSLADMAAQAAGHLACPRCGCRDLRADKTIQRDTQTVRYRTCRHCGHKVLTRQPREEIIRDVVPHDENSNAGIVELTIHRMAS